MTNNSNAVNLRTGDLRATGTRPGQFSGELHRSAPYNPFAQIHPLQSRASVARLCALLVSASPRTGRLQTTFRKPTMAEAARITNGDEAFFAREVRRQLDYDPAAGNLIWRPKDVCEFSSESYGRAWNTRYSGKVAGYKSNIKNGDNRYRMVSFCGGLHRAHRLVWLWHNGEWPRQHIDHINGDPFDNRVENLRDVSPRENSLNQAANCNNRSGRIGVYWREDHKRWQASITVGFKAIHLGSFASFEEAVRVRSAAEKKYGYHPNHGRPAI